MKALDDYGGYRTTVIALRLMLLTFVRTVELRAAQWAEIDLDRAEWRIPAERMKMRELHARTPGAWFIVSELPHPSNLRRVRAPP